MCEKLDRLTTDRNELIAAMRNNLPAELMEIVDRIECDDKGHFLSWSQDNPNQISYAAKPEHKVDSAKRVRTALGRYLGRQYGVTITPTIEKSINAIFADVGYNDCRFEVRSDVVAVYSAKNGPQSCMKGEDDIVEFYENNGVRVVTYTSPGEDSFDCRALLWNTDKGEFLDRIYPNSGPHIEQYIEWAKRRGCAIRGDHSMGGSHGDYNVKNIRVGRMPYLDTFCWLSGNQLSTRARGLQCHNTDGSEPLECDGCSEWYFEEDGTDGCCADCAGQRFYCESCNEYCSDDDVTEVGNRTMCSGCADNCSFCCERCDQRTHNDNHYSVDDQSVCSSCFEDSSSCDYCNECTFRDCTQIDDQTCCSDCAETSTACDRCDERTFDSTDIDGQTCCPGCADDAVACDCCGLPTFETTIPLLTIGRDLCHECETTETSDQQPATSNQGSDQGERPAIAATSNQQLATA